MPRFLHFTNNSYLLILKGHMKAEQKETESGFRRKVYTKMYNSSMSQIRADCEKPRKKIIPTCKKLGLREEFKKTFLPLLIDVFELRQMIQNYRSDNDSSLLKALGKKAIPPKKILKRLKELQEEITESRRWVEGVIDQIDKGICEAKEALEGIDEEKIKPQEEEKPRDLSEKVKLELNDLLDEENAASRLFSRLFKKRKK